MSEENQLCFADELLNRRGKVSRMFLKLERINKVIDWQPIVERFSVIDKTKQGKGGHPRTPLIWMAKAIFLQSLFNLSDPELEDQLVDRLSFQRFVGINLDHEIPDFTTFWRFKESLSLAGLEQVIFEQVTTGLEARGLILKKGTLVDAVILTSGNRPLSDKRREELETDPNPQIDTDAHSTKKRGKWYFGYKGHVGVDVQSKLIRKQVFTPANCNDQVPLQRLISYDEESLWGDKAYYLEAWKVAARKQGWFYGVLDKPNRGERLSEKQKRRNKKFSRVRAQVEHPFAWMRTKANLVVLRAKNRRRNAFKFAGACACWNACRGSWLLEHRPGGGLVCP